MKEGTDGTPSIIQPVFKLQKRIAKKLAEDKPEQIKRRKLTQLPLKYEKDEDYKAFSNTIFRVEKTV